MRLNLVWNPAICSSENGKYVRGISEDLVSTCDEIMYATKSISTKNVPTKTLSTKSISKYFYILLTFFIALFIAVRIYRYFIKHQAKEKHLLSYHFRTKRLKEVL